MAVMQGLPTTVCFEYGGYTKVDTNYIQGSQAQKRQRKRKGYFLMQVLMMKAMKRMLWKRQTTGRIVILMVINLLVL